MNAPDSNVNVASLACLSYLGDRTEVLLAVTMEIRIDLGELRHALDTCTRLSNAVGTINPRPPGLHNDLIQHPKKLVSRLLDRYTRSQREFNSSAVRSLNILASSIDNLQTTFQALDGRLTRLERDNAALTSSLQTCTAILATLESLANSQTSSGRETALASMEGDWDKRARDNSRFYSDTGHGESEEAFEKSGERNVDDQILADIELSSEATVLELGCGIGRLLKPLAPRAAAVIGIDISGEMVRQAQERFAVFPNVRIHKTRGDLSPVETSSVDFCFCVAVFEHFPSKEPVFQYFEEASRVLRPGGIFRFQVNQRPEKSGRSQVADTWNGVGLDRAEVAAHLGQAGFRILDTWGEMSHNAWYTAEEAKKPRLNGPEARVLYHPLLLQPVASQRVFERIGEQPSASTLEGLLSRRLAWREALDFLLEKWSRTTLEEFIRSVYRALLSREVEDDILRATLALMPDDSVSRSVFLDTVVSSKEFRDVLGGLSGRPEGSRNVNGDR